MRASSCTSSRNPSCPRRGAGCRCCLASHPPDSDLTADLAVPHHLIVPTLANSTVFVTAYLAAGALIWAVADASMASPAISMPLRHARPRSAPMARRAFVGRPCRRRALRLSHRERAIGAARQRTAEAGPKRARRPRTPGPARYVLITGDMTDAGSSAEWAEFLDAMAAHPRLAERVLILPGNHDLNIVDRANPARMDLPTSPTRLRQLRALSAMRELQGNRVRVVNYSRRRCRKTVREHIEPHLKQMAGFADRATRSCP